MAGSHVAHNCRLANAVILANGALLSGHVEIADRAFISGGCLLHQFVRVGTLALMQGGAAISKDLPPYTVAARGNGLCGLNVIGLRRAGFTPAQRLELKELYRRIFIEGQNLSDALARAREEFTGVAAREVLDFVAASRRGVCRHRGSVDLEDE
jgi:UDP-N-acetylglucosamine acyltransferase